MSAELAEVDDWEWTEEREKCLEMLLDGMSKVGIGKKLDKHRNTINSWCAHPAFLARATEMMEDRRNRSTFKRSREALILTDIAAQQAVKAGQKIEADPDNAHEHRRTFREFADEWRQGMRAEREALGINVQRVESRVVGSVRHTHHAGQSFKDALVKSIRSGVIDVEAIEVKKGMTPMDVVREATRKMLSANDGAALNARHEEERAAEEATPQKKR